MRCLTAQHGKFWVASLAKAGEQDSTGASPKHLEHLRVFGQTGLRELGRPDAELQSCSMTSRCDWSGIRSLCWGLLLGGKQRPGRPGQQHAAGADTAGADTAATARSKRSKRSMAHTAWPTVPMAIEKNQAWAWAWAWSGPHLRYR